MEAQSAAGVIFTIIPNWVNFGGGTFRKTSGTPRGIFNAIMLVHSGGRRSQPPISCVALRADITRSQRTAATFLSLASLLILFFFFNEVKVSIQFRPQHGCIYHRNGIKNDVYAGMLRVEESPRRT